MREKNRSPFFYFDTNELAHCSKKYTNRHFTLLYAVKACLFKGLVKFLDPFVDGFSVSSLKELEITESETKKPIHFVSPLIRKVEIEKINALANNVIFNSLEQFERYKNMLSSKVGIFLRVNPEYSIIEDKKYNPCRKHSKLGIPLNELKNYLLKNEKNSITGIHFHNACQEADIQRLTKTFNKIKETLGDSFTKIQSINIGGGYLSSSNNFDRLEELSKEINLIIEPGFDLVNSSGYLVSSVVDLFERDGKKIAILDTSVNHLPEVFEYDTKPQIIDETSEKEGIPYMVTGATCLAGDIFGDYYFKKPLEIDGHVIFKDVGAYSLVKAHSFNGLRLPKVIMKDQAVKDFLNPRKGYLL